MPQKSMNSRRRKSRPLPIAARRRRTVLRGTAFSEVTMCAGRTKLTKKPKTKTELDEAQAEAEALLAAEAGGTGMTEARAEVRAPAGTAGYTQRAPRPGSFDRRPGRRGGRSGGGGGRRSAPASNTVRPLITDLLKEGQEILVQIAKEPIGKKGARITSHIALPGTLPGLHADGESHRRLAQDCLRRRAPAAEAHHSAASARTGTADSSSAPRAMNAAEEELRADIRFLKNLWAEIKSRAEAGKAPTLIYHDLNVVERVLRDQVTSDFSAIWVDSDEEYERILRFANRFQPALVRARQALHQRDAAVRTVRPERGNQQGAQVESLAEERRLHRHQPDRSAGGDRRQHRQVRRQDAAS